MSRRASIRFCSRMCSVFFESFFNFPRYKWFLFTAVIFYQTQFSLANSAVVGFPTTSTDLFTNRSGCLYGGRRYKNGAEVPTSQRCLRCQCVAAQLVCRLRVCSAVPDPPPPGCILLQRQADCCRRLVCNQDGTANENTILEGRSRNGNLVLSQNGSGCVHNGTVYGEGSAMSTSSQCEYCYCIRGQQHCVKPQCILAMPGCQPVFTKHSCCPIKYNCSHSVSTTTSQPILPSKGCSINGSHYSEGDMLTGFAKKCESCYCVQGQARCEPVTCSVPNGAKKHCSPVYSDDHCCPTSYKCSQQSNEDMLKETRNYNRKNVLQDRTADLATERKSHTTDSELTMSSKKNDSMVASQTNSTKLVLNSIKNNSSHANLKNSTEPVLSSKKNDSTDVEKTDSNKLVLGSKKNDSTDVKETISSELVMSSKKNDSLNRPESVTNSNESTFPTETTLITTTEDLVDVTTDFMTTDEYTTSNLDDSDSSTLDSTEFPSTKETDFFSTTLDTVTPFLPTILPSSTVKNYGNSSDAESLKNNESSTTTAKSIPPELEAILNSTRNKEHSEDYDYDYNESSLPPSLPNLRIIPFVAADAVVAKTENSAANLNYHLPVVHGPNKPVLPTNRKPPYYKGSHLNRFSPPTETEGGFVPKEPILDHSPYEGKLDFPFHSLGFNIEITVPPTVDQALPAPGTKLDKICVHNGKRYSHGDVVSEPISCNICSCYFGEVVCQEPKCSPMQTGCYRIHDPAVGCCGRIVCGANDLDSPTRVIDRVDHVTPIPGSLHTPYSTSNIPAFTVADIVSTPDPFRDVIRTEPAPDLPSLIGEIIHLWDQTTQQYSTSSLPSITTGSDEENRIGSNIETNSVSNGSNSIDRIDVGFGSNSANDETISTPTIFHSNSTKMEVKSPNEEHLSSSSSIEDVLFSSTPSPHVENSKPVSEFFHKSDIPTTDLILNHLNSSIGVTTPKTVETKESTTVVFGSTITPHISTRKNVLGTSPKATTKVSEMMSTSSSSSTASNPSSSLKTSTSHEQDSENLEGDDDLEAQLKNEEEPDYNDNFSFDSVFKFFFDSGTEASETSTAKLPISETVTPSTPAVSTSRKPVSLKTPIVPVTTIKPSQFSTTTNKTIVTSLRAPGTTNRPQVKVSPIKHTYFSSRITAKPVKDIIRHSSSHNKNLTTSNNQTNNENQQGILLESVNTTDTVTAESNKPDTEKPIIYINRFHSLSSDLKNRNRTVTRVPGIITRTSPPSTKTSNGTVTDMKTDNSGTVNKVTGSATVNKIPSTGILNRTSGTGTRIGSINRTPGTSIRTPGTYSRIPGNVSRLSSSTLAPRSTTTESLKPNSAVHPTTADPSAVTGLLKLAGCNIYGRMYRVGRIITELSGPCLECMCTEVGVQCRPLPC